MSAYPPELVKNPAARPGEATIAKLGVLEGAIVVLRQGKRAIVQWE